MSAHSGGAASLRVQADGSLESMDAVAVMLGRCFTTRGLRERVEYAHRLATELEEDIAWDMLSDTVAAHLRGVVHALKAVATP